MVVHQVGFDIPSADLGGLEPLFSDLDMASADIDFDMVDDGDLGFDKFLGLLMDLPISGDAGVQGQVSVLPLHMMLYLSKDGMMDLDSAGYSQFTSDLANDVPLDVAFLDAFEVLQGEGQGLVSSELVSAVSDAGQDPTNFFRVVGNAERVCVHFFAVIVNNNSTGVEVKDGYFLINDGTWDDSFTAAFAQVFTHTTSTGGSSGGCSAMGTAPLLLLLGLPLITLLRK
jgi:Synergist-CTERM protein sorting domain-containing protein